MDTRLAWSLISTGLAAVLFATAWVGGFTRSSHNPKVPASHTSSVLPNVVDVTPTGFCLVLGTVRQCLSVPVVQ